MRSRWMSSIFALVVALLAFSSALLAQAPNQIPRTADGKPNFAGIWDDATPSLGGAANPNPALRTRRPTRAQLARELPVTPWGREQVQHWISGDGEYAGETGAPEDPRYHSLCGGPASPAVLSTPVEIVQNPVRLLLVHYGSGGFGLSRMWARQLWIGREHPKDLTDYNPTWMGHSVAKWDGDTLVVDTVGIREGTLIDTRLAAPQSGQMHMVERYELVDNRTLRVDRTFTDPKTYTRPWGNSRVFKLQTDWNGFAEDWEVAENHTICEGGTFPREHDPWFENYDKIKVLPNAKK